MYDVSVDVEHLESLFYVIFMYRCVDIHIDVYLFDLINVLMIGSVYTHTHIHIYELSRVLV